MTEFPMNLSNSKNEWPCNYLNRLFSSNTIKINSIMSEGNKIVFKKPYSITFSKNDDGFYAVDDYLDIQCFGGSINDLKEDLIDELTEIFNGYVKIDKNELDKSGLVLRNKFKSMIK